MIKYLPLTSRLDGAIEGDLNIKKRSVKEKQRKNSSLLSSAMRGDYTIEPLVYGVHHRGIRLVELFGVPSD